MGFNKIIDEEVRITSLQCKSSEGLYLSSTNLNAYIMLCCSDDCLFHTVGRNFYIP